ncbi:MAG: cellulase family glycosylhydrolase [Bacteroidaceae bacterium]|nr:cellulase family glycosylhydrolase [Bacteroidaceae bacterium]
MKKLIYTFFYALVAVVGMTACSDDDPANPGGGGDDAEEQILTLDLKNNLATTYDVAFAANANWKVTSDQDWAVPAVPRGTAGADKKLTVIIAQNNTEATRTAVLKCSEILSGNTLWTLTITQPPYTYSPDDDAPEAMKLNARETLAAMKAGWNLGNTFEAIPWDWAQGKTYTLKEYETAWQTTETSQAIIDAVAAQGFNAVRIPVRWYIHADPDMQHIDKAFLARIKQVVDYCYKHDMYVLINSHHDTWYDRYDGTISQDVIMQRVTTMWTQIAEYFRDYDEHLLFGGFNEVITLDAAGKEDWNTYNTSNRAYMTQLTQTFVNAVRATGGNNEWRVLFVQPWAASPDFALSSQLPYLRPDDVHEGRLCLEFHYYQPYNYCMQSSGDKEAWGNKYFWGQPYAAEKYCATDDESKMTELFDHLQETFIRQGLPVVMAECGAVHHVETDDNKSFGIDWTKAEESRCYYHKTLFHEAALRGIPAFLWDNNAWGGDGENFGYIDRANCKPYTQGVLDAVMEGTKK